MSNQHSQKKKTGWTIILVLALLGAIACVGVVLIHMIRGNETQEAYEEVAEAVTDDVDEEAEAENVSLSELESAAFDEREGAAPRVPKVKSGPVDNPIDFKALGEINPDIYAWITIKDTNIDYPVAQREGDDTFYLHHDLYGDPKFAGCIYSEDKNAKDFSDPLTVLYGHNMRNGSMFQNLHKFRDPEFFDSHPEFYVYTADHRYTYRIFAAYVFDNRHLINSLIPQSGWEEDEIVGAVPEATNSAPGDGTNSAGNTADSAANTMNSAADSTDLSAAGLSEDLDAIDEEAIYADYFKAIMDTYSLGGNRREDVELDKDSKVLTLSTCIGGDPGRRFLVQALMTEERETR